ncbi:hypothetical protein OSTOST_08310, partial [Ostertagia ostertagi]
HRARPVSVHHNLAPISRRTFEPIEICWSGAKWREQQLLAGTVASPRSSYCNGSMRIGDLKRAVEDVILRPDQNPLNDLDKRDTIAALDLCQPEPSPPLPACQPSAASMNACSCSSETVPVDVPRPPPPLCTSTSLDTIVNRPQPVLYRHSAGVSRRQSRVLSTLQSKRKRSNSLTNYQKTFIYAVLDRHQCDSAMMILTEVHLVYSDVSFLSVGPKRRLFSGLRSRRGRNNQYTEPDTAPPPSKITSLPANFNPYLTYRNHDDLLLDTGETQEKNLEFGHARNCCEHDLY